MIEATVESDIDREAIEWALAHLPGGRAEPVSTMPWARLYVLRNELQSLYLKILPQQTSTSVKGSAAIAGRFPAQLPEVVALEPARGWLLSRDHAGRTLGYDSENDDLIALVGTYARLQAAAARDSGLLQSLRAIDTATLLPRLLAFLEPAAETGAASDLDESRGAVVAEYFLGRKAAGRYHRLLSRRLPLLAAHLEGVEALPPTLNHGDLRPPNAAITANGDCVLFDWDDALTGPAGLSLHGLFSGCTRPAILLSGSAVAQAAASTPAGQRIRAYVDALAEAGYAGRSMLERHLPAAICCGMIQFILDFGRFSGETGRRDVGGTMRSRLSDLLDLCDWLGSRDRVTAMELVEDYVAHGDGHRGQRMLQDLVARFPEDHGALARFAWVCADSGDLDLAAEGFGEALEKSPDDPNLLAGMARVHLRRLELEESENRLVRALSLKPDAASAREELERVRALQRMRSEAREPTRMPILHYSPGEADAGRAPPEKVALGAEMFDEHGAIQIDNAFPLELVRRLSAEFMRRYEPYFNDNEHPDALRLGDKRFMLTVDIDELFGAPELIGSPMLMPILHRIVGEDCVLGAYTAVISMPGSRDQRLHKDHPALFPDSAWHFRSPCFGAQIILPLVPLDEHSGTTRFFKGSHRRPTSEALQHPHQDPMVPLGGCLLTDYRCAHRGLGNRSDVVRPILTLIYNRPWFRDFKNYGRQPPLRLADAAYQQLPDETKDLVEWWREESRVAVLGRSQLLPTV